MVHCVSHDVYVRCHAQCYILQHLCTLLYNGRCCTKLKAGWLPSIRPCLFKTAKYPCEYTSYIILTGNEWPRPLPHKAGLRREGLQLDGRPTEIEAGIVFATVPDTQEVPLANQISRCRS